MNKLFVLLGIIENFISGAVVQVIKEAVIEASTRSEWNNGEKTQFVIDKAREVAAASENIYDDLLLEIAVKLYVARWKGRVSA